jgi:hypothetical protein
MNTCGCGIPVTGSAKLRIVQANLRPEPNTTRPKIRRPEFQADNLRHLRQIPNDQNGRCGLFDYLVGALNGRRWNGDAEFLGASEIDRQFESGCRLYS